MTFQFQHLFAILEVPNSDRLVVTSAGDILAIWAEDNTINITLMTLKIDQNEHLQDHIL